MVNGRNSFTYIANITILSVSLLLFAILTNPTTQFEVLCFFALILGSLTTLFYSFKISEKTLTN